MVCGKEVRNCSLKEKGKEESLADFFLKMVVVCDQEVRNCSYCSKLWGSYTYTTLVCTCLLLFTVYLCMYLLSF